MSHMHRDEVLRREDQADRLTNTKKELGDRLRGVTLEQRGMNGDAPIHVLVFARPIQRSLAESSLGDYFGRGNGITRSDKAGQFLLHIPPKIATELQQGFGMELTQSSITNGLAKTGTRAPIPNGSYAADVPAPRQVIASTESAQAALQSALRPPTVIWHDARKSKYHCYFCSHESAQNAQEAFNILLQNRDFGGAPIHNEGGFPLITIGSSAGQELLKDMFAKAPAGMYQVTSTYEEMQDQLPAEPPAIVKVVRRA